MPEFSDSADVLVRVVDVTAGRAIGRASVVDKLQDRIAELRAGMLAGARAVSADLDQLPERQHWQVSELSATFGVTLTADAGVVLSRAGAEATFEVTVTFTRK
ncbi:CU044_2847 family protein [Verrucosispora sp. WMMC514]|uniref:CU044_2847 family protein n=1 Tax=Verrucosispora sp. WMMC514 TaxID=3015156 RepID=UPI00248B7E31|nr:CU044_2847 family protein [Verrucosispora sp. WMMC514]WBB91417.1 CU044_2847 family protein [Verrucosispora sp. WMMC514]